MPTDYPAPWRIDYRVIPHNKHGTTLCLVDARGRVVVFGLTEKEAETIRDQVNLSRITEAA